MFLAPVAAGITALCTAPAAILSRQGGVWHRRWGKIFLWAIAVPVVSALTLLTMRPNLVLLMVSIVVFHSAFAGYRARSHKRPDLGQKPHWLDWVAAVIAAASGVVLIVVMFAQGGGLVERGCYQGVPGERPGSPDDLLARGRCGSGTGRTWVADARR